NNLPSARSEGSEGGPGRNDARGNGFSGCWQRGASPEAISAYHPGAAAADDFIHLGERGHRRVPGGGHRKRAVGGPILDRFCRIVELQEAVGKSRGKAVSAADAVEDLEMRVGIGLVKLS